MISPEDFSPGDCPGVSKLDGWGDADVDDWTDGVGRTSEQLLADLRSGMGGMGMGGTGTTMRDAGGMGMMASRVLGGDAGDVRPLYLLKRPRRRRAAHPKRTS